MTWQPPNDTGGQAPTGYRVTRVTGDIVQPNAWTTVVPASQLSVRFTYLINDTTYTFSVAAITEAGEGPAVSGKATPTAPIANDAGVEPIDAGVSLDGGASDAGFTVVAQATSPFLVTSNPYNQDTEYRVTSSLRQANAPNPLPFVMPARSALALSPHKAWAHYFPLFPVSVENGAPETDYYAKNWLLAGGEGGVDVAYGGFLRDRPTPRAALSGDWELIDATNEATWARNAGLDGFLVDTLGWSGANYTRGLNAFRGAAALGDPTFKVAYMVDTDIVSGTDAVTAVAACTRLASSP